MKRIKLYSLQHSENEIELGDTKLGSNQYFFGYKISHDCQIQQRIAKGCEENSPNMSCFEIDIVNIVLGGLDLLQPQTDGRMWVIIGYSRIMMMPCIQHFKNDGAHDHFTCLRFPLGIVSFMSCFNHHHALAISPNPLLHNLCRSSVAQRYCHLQIIATHWMSLIFQAGVASWMQASLCCAFTTNCSKYDKIWNFMCKLCSKIYRHLTLFSWTSQI